MYLRESQLYGKSCILGLHIYLTMPMHCWILIFVIETLQFELNVPNIVCTKF